MHVTYASSAMESTETEKTGSGGKSSANATKMRIQCEPNGPPFLNYRGDISAQPKCDTVALQLVT